MKNTFMISFDNVSKSYGSKILFENVTFNINKGERIVDSSKSNSEDAGMSMDKVIISKEALERLQAVSMA